MSISYSKTRLPFSTNGLFIEDGQTYFVPLFFSALGINTAPINFAKLLIASLFTALLVGSLISIYLYLSSSSNEKLWSKRAFRLERLNKGWKWRVPYNLSAFVYVGFAFANINFLIQSVLGIAIYAWWQYLAIHFACAIVHTIFFTVSSTLLDLRAQKLSNL